MCGTVGIGGFHVNPRTWGKTRKNRRAQLRFTPSSDGARTNANGFSWVNPRYQRELVRMTDRLYRQVNVQVRPVEVVEGRPLNASDGADSGVPKPGKLCERNKQLFVSEQDPEAVRGYVCYLSR